MFPSSGWVKMMGCWALLINRRRSMSLMVSFSISFQKEEIANTGHWSWFEASRETLSRSLVPLINSPEEVSSISANIWGNSETSWVGSSESIPSVGPLDLMDFPQNSCSLLFLAETATSLSLMSLLSSDSSEFLGFMDEAFTINTSLVLFPLLIRASSGPWFKFLDIWLSVFAFVSLTGMFVLISMVSEAKWLWDSEMFSWIHGFHFCEASCEQVKVSWPFPSEEDSALSMLSVKDTLLSSVAEISTILLIEIVCSFFNGEQSISFPKQDKSLSSVNLKDAVEEGGSVESTAMETLGDNKDFLWHPASEWSLRGADKVSLILFLLSLKCMEGSNWRDSVIFNPLSFTFRTLSIWRNNDSSQIFAFNCPLFTKDVSCMLLEIVLKLMCPTSGFGRVVPKLLVKYTGKLFENLKSAEASKSNVFLRCKWSVLCAVEVVLIPWSDSCSVFQTFAGRLLISSRWINLSSSDSLCW